MPPAGHSVDEYLETIYFLAFPIGEYTPRGAGSPPLASRVAEMLHVSRASAGEMLKRLEAEGLIERGARKEALLTERGRERAERVVRKHRIIERLLTDFMGYSGYEAHERADELGDTFDDEMVERIDERLGHPERCPHGWPVDPQVEQAENAELAPGLEGDDRPAGRARRRAAALVLRPAAGARRGAGGGTRRPGRRPVRRPPRRRPARDLREGGGRAVRQAGAGVAAAPRPAARRRASARSVRSQVNSASSRPK